eukprot:Sspe_Gene.102670::Locus_78528_Transcript_1_1_Confidence_1.000_Length_2035::g.102670::m.102670
MHSKAVAFLVVGSQGLDKLFLGMGRIPTVPLPLVPGVAVRSAQIGCSHTDRPVRPELDTAQAKARGVLIGEKRPAFCDSIHMLGTSGKNHDTDFQVASFEGLLERSALHRSRVSLLRHPVAFAGVVLHSFCCECHLVLVRVREYGPEVLPQALHLFDHPTGFSSACLAVDAAALRLHRVRVDSRHLQCLAVHHCHVPAEVLEVHRFVRRDLVEVVFGGLAALLQPRLIVARCQDPLPCGRLGTFTDLRDEPRDVLHCPSEQRPAHVDVLYQLFTNLDHVGVAVHKGREHGFPLKVHLFCVVVRFAGIADALDDTIGYNHFGGTPPRIHRVNRPTVVQCVSVDHRHDSACKEEPTYVVHPAHRTHPPMKYRD